MDALFVVVAELLLVPLVLWILIAVELTLGLAVSVVSYLLGRRSLEQALTHGLRAVQRRLLWSVVVLGAGLVLVDLLMFDPIVGLVLSEVDAREDLDIGYGAAEGSFILGRVELTDVAVTGVRDGDRADPSAHFEVVIDSLVIDVDTLALLGARFAVEDIAVEGVRGSFDRLRTVDRDRVDADRGFELDREFSVERVHFGAVALELRDHTKPPFASEAHAEGPRELDLVLDELDLGPLRSDTAIFDLLYRVRGRGSVAGVGFALRSATGPPPQTEVEVEVLPLSLLGDAIAEQTGLAVDGSAALWVTNVYREDPPEPRVELGVQLQLRELELGLAEDPGLKGRLALKVAERGIEKLGRDIPVTAELTILRSELEGVRSLAEAGIIEAVSRALVSSLREQMR